MAGAHEVRGTAASPGIAIGPAHLAGEIEECPWPRGDTGAERRELAEAIRTSIDTLTELIGRSDHDSAAILEFQIEMLSDPALTDMVTEQIEAGEAAAFAWRSTLDSYIRDMEDADDEQVRARAVDVADIRNRVLGAIAGNPVEDFPAGSVFVGRELEPSRFLAHDWSSGGGIALFSGSTASHVTMLAQAKSVPMVVGTGSFSVAELASVLVDGDAGTVLLQPDREDVARARAAIDRRPGPTERLSKTGRPLTADGVPIGVSINVNDLAEAAYASLGAVEGIGLVRSEFVLPSPADAANEDRQFVVYRGILEHAGKKPVIIRMLDLGGDKPLPGLAQETRNPFLGMRGIRLLLARTELARPQARALLRAAAQGDIRVLLPMVTLASEVEEMVAIFRQEALDLAGKGVAHRFPPIGIMVEVPATALMLDSFGEADFFSIGTNDLAQYVTAAARDNPLVAPIYVQARPALLRLIRIAVDHATAMGKAVSICGDMAADPRCLPDLLATGLRHISVPPARLEATLDGIAALRADGDPVAGE
ncbi:putative PEP-binding protein [Rhizobium sp. BK251]|uniref:putative PEP-binding protein n=1 Tax=Rhizobium sp. BK251 TaxID=2512125 RepID=UPI0010DE19FA|nr:putative PEP-binding protein [Rhizobium sp. BK251]TCL65198.1 phosphoenolpyruvate--protein phosphotransferase [Rhizobium sp. BK251]